MVKGAFIIAGIQSCSRLIFCAILGSASATLVELAGLQLSVLTDIYTAYLFAQAKARECAKIHY